MTLKHTAGAVGHGSDDGWAALLGDVYDASLDGRRWPDVVRRVAGTFDSGMCCLHSYDMLRRRGATNVEFNLDDTARRAYAEYFCQLNPWIPQGRRQGAAGEILVGSQVISDAQLERTEFYTDLLRRRDLFYSLGVVLGQEGQMRVSVTLLRSRARGDFDAREQRRLARLGQHLQRAREVQARLAAVDHERGALADVLDQLPLGVVLLAPGGRVLVANRAARRFAAARDGFELGADSLRPTDGAAAARLRALLAGAAAIDSGVPGGGWLLLQRPSGRRPYALLAAPLGRSERGPDAPSRQAVGIAFISDPEETPRDADDALGSLFGLTRAECGLASGLLAGLSVEQAAAQRGIRVATARTHLSRIFAKTRTSRQAQLVTLLERCLKPSESGVRTTP